MLLEALQNPLVIAIVVLILLLLIAIPVVVRRRRASHEEVLPPPELGQSIDYTSLPYEEPNGWGDRFARAPLPTKLLLVLVPLVLLVGGAVLALTFLRSPLTAEAPTPVIPAATITNVVADVAGPSKILVKADTTLPDGSTVAAALRENGQDFAWFNPQTATAEVADGRISLTMDKLRSAPVPRQDQEYTVVVTATVGGQAISSEPAKLTITPIYQAAFYQTTAAAPTGQPTVAPTTAAIAPPTTAPATPAPATPEVTVTPTATLTATVGNGGNIRQDPNLSGTVLGQLHAGEVVSLLEKSSNGQWYRVDAPEATGWVSATLLRIDRAVASQVPVAGQTQPPTPAPTGLSAKVFNGGNVRDQPNLSGKVLDQINAGETVQLLGKTSDGAWYQITNIRGVTGWVSRTLLTIAPDVISRVPVSG